MASCSQAHVCRARHIDKVPHPMLRFSPLLHRRGSRGLGYALIQKCYGTAPFAAQQCRELGSVAWHGMACRSAWHSWWLECIGVDCLESSSRTNLAFASRSSQRDTAQQLSRSRAHCYLVPCMLQCLIMTTMFAATIGQARTNLRVCTIGVLYSAKTVSSFINQLMHCCAVLL